MSTLCLMSLCVCLPVYAADMSTLCLMSWCVCAYLYSQHVYTMPHVTVCTCLSMQSTCLHSMPHVTVCLSVYAADMSTLCLMSLCVCACLYSQHVIITMYTCLTSCSRPNILSFLMVIIGHLLDRATPLITTGLRYGRSVSVVTFNGQSLTTSSPSLFHSTGVLVGQYLQQVTPRLSLGAELMGQYGPQIPCGQMSMLSFGGRYVGESICVAVGFCCRSSGRPYHWAIWTQVDSVIRPLFDHEIRPPVDHVIFVDDSCLLYILLLIVAF